MIAPRSILRVAWRSSAWLAVGLIITVAVSWGLAAWMPQGGWDRRIVVAWPDYEGQRDWLFIETFQAPGCTRRTWHCCQSNSLYNRSPFRNAILGGDDLPMVQYTSEWFPLGWPRWGNTCEARDALRSESPQAIATQAGRPFEVIGCEHATGWPLRAMWYEIVPVMSVTTHRSQVPEVTQVTMRDGLSLSSPQQQWPALRIADMRALPGRPIWLGLAINSFFWGLALFWLLRGPILIRATVRLRRGLCPACAYDLRNNPTPGCPECGWNRPQSQEAQATT